MLWKHKRGNFGYSIKESYVTIEKGGISEMGNARVHIWGVKMDCVLGDLLVILCVWNIESMLECAATEAQ